MKSVIVIPARLESTRLPRKLLLNETGRPLIQHTWEQACLVKNTDVVITTDSHEIYNTAYRFGAKCLMTSSDHTNGTERVAEAVEILEGHGKRYETIVNVQGDEAEVHPEAVERLIEAFERVNDTGSYCVGTLHSQMNQDYLGNPDVVKVIVDEHDALYFTRHPIPYAWHHLGVYAYSRNGLSFIRTLRESETEAEEHLEQLRFIAANLIIHSEYWPVPFTGINTREDYDSFVQRQKVMA